MIYTLKHPSKELNGMFGAVGFQNGRGSTSNKVDADLCVKLGCELVREYEPPTFEETAKVEAEKAKPEKAKVKPEDKPAAFPKERRKIKLKKHES